MRASDGVVPTAPRMRGESPEAAEQLAYQVVEWCERRGWHPRDIDILGGSPYVRSGAMLDRLCTPAPEAR